MEASINCLKAINGKLKSATVVFRNSETLLNGYKGNARTGLPKKPPEFWLSNQTIFCWAILQMHFIF